MQVPSRKMRQEDPTPILIVCEDKRSLLYYIRAKIKHLKLNPRQNREYPVRAEHYGSAAITVVTKAIEEKDTYNGENQIGYGKVYCVMDVDPTNGQPQASLESALKEIDDENKLDQNSEIIPIISNECVEVWYLFHFEKSRPPALHRKKNKGKTETVTDRYKLDKWLKKHLGKYKKNEEHIFSLLREKGGDEANAIRLAKESQQHDENVRDGAPYCENPSTTVYRLIEQLNEMSDSIYYIPSNIPIDNNLLKKFGLNPNEPFVKELASRIEAKYSAISTEEKLHLLSHILKDPLMINEVIKDFGKDDGLVLYFCEHVNWVDQSGYLEELR